MEFEHEEYEGAEELEKKSITFGFSAILDSIVNNERSHHGYTKLEPEEPKVESVKEILRRNYYAVQL